MNKAEVPEKDTFAARKTAAQKKKKIYMFLGWPLLAVGTGMLFPEGWRVPAIVIIITGLIFRMLYYHAIVECRSLEKYEKMAEKSKLKLIFFFSAMLLFVSSPSHAALDAGDIAESLNGLESVNPDVRISLPDEKSENKLSVIMFWATWDKSSLLALPLIAKLSEQYGSDIFFGAVSKEDKSAVSAFISKQKTPLPVEPAVDTDGRICDSYIGNNIPLPVFFVIDRKHKVLWRGGVIELEGVLSKIFKGTFDLEKQKKITALHRKLKLNMQMEKTGYAAQAADDILELDPSDELAMRIRLYIFERDGKLPDSLPYIDRLIDKSPETSYLYFIKLDLLDRLGRPRADIAQLCEKIKNRFNDSHEVLEELARFETTRLSFGKAPLKTAIESINRAVSMLLFDTKEKPNPAKLAKYLTTQARVYYLAGRIPKAAEIQKEALKLCRGMNTEQQARSLLEYYTEAAETAQSSMEE